MNKLYFAFFLALASFSVKAQTQPVIAPISSLPTLPDSIPKTFGRWYLPAYQPTIGIADTAGALVSLFATKRQNTWWYLPVAVLGVALIVPGERTVNGVRTNSIPPDTWQYATGIPIMMGGVGTVIARLSTFSRARLSLIQHDYERGKPIPASIRRKLKPKYFAQAAIMRTSIIQQLQMEKFRAERRALRKR